MLDHQSYSTHDKRRSLYLCFEDMNETLDNKDPGRHFLKLIFIHHMKADTLSIKNNLSIDVWFNTGQYLAEIQL